MTILTGMRSEIAMVPASAVPTPVLVTLMVYWTTAPGIALAVVETPVIGSEITVADFTTSRLGDGGVTVTVFTEQRLFVRSYSNTLLAAGFTIHVPPLGGFWSAPDTVVAVVAVTSARTQPP